MLVKLDENGNLIHLPKTGTLETYNEETEETEVITVSNYDALDEEILLANGWKPLVETPMPEPDEGYGYRTTYEDTGDEIVQSWEKYELPPEPTPQLSAEEMWDAYMEGYNDDGE